MHKKPCITNTKRKSVHQEILIVSIGVCIMLFLHVLQQRFSVPLPVSILLFGIATILVVRCWRQFLQIRDRDKLPESDIQEVQEEPQACNTAFAVYTLLFMLVVLILLTVLVPLSFKPIEELDKLQGVVTKCEFYDHDCLITIRHNGGEKQICVGNAATKLRHAISVGDNVEVVLDRSFARALKRNGETLCTYEQYKASERKFVPLTTTFFGVAALGLMWWWIYKAPKKHSGDQKSGEAV